MLLRTAKQFKSHVFKRSSSLAMRSFCIDNNKKNKNDEETLTDSESNEKRISESIKSPKNILYSNSKLLEFTDAFRSRTIKSSLIGGPLCFSILLTNFHWLIQAPVVIFGLSLLSCKTNFY